MNFVNELILYIKEKYHIIPEQPWKKYPEKMAFKAAETNKWFALIMPVERKKLGLAEDGEVFIVNVKSDPEFIYMVSQTEGYMPAYHMNKQHWLTVLLDGTVPLNQIFERIDESYQLITTVRVKEFTRR